MQFARTEFQGGGWQTPLLLSITKFGGLITTFTTITSLPESFRKHSRFPQNEWTDLFERLQHYK